MIAFRDNQVSVNEIFSRIVEARECLEGCAYQLKQDGFTFDMGSSLITAPYLLDDLYFVGAGTHPGAGIPGVLLSADITSRLGDGGYEKQEHLQPLRQASRPTCHYKHALTCHSERSEE
ncbi:MAG TPA: hypothetical protein VJ761_23595 [Ktedonobacteraceae bacterium]|nr:hypothetical protein [Ktedonobacteraceae bacterium]